MKSRSELGPVRPIRGGIGSAIMGLFYGDVSFLYEQRLFFLRLALVSIVFGAITSWSWVTAGNFQLVTILIPVLVALIAAILFFIVGKFEYGVLALIPIAALMNFYSVPTGTQSRVPLSMVAGLGLVGLWLIQIIFLRKDPGRLAASPINAPMLFLVFEMILSYGWSTVMRDPLVVVPTSFLVVQVAALTVNIFLPLTALFTANVLKEVRWIKYLAWTIVGSGALIIVLVYLNLPIDSLYNSGYRGLYASWVCAIAFALVLFMRNMRLWLRLGLAGVVAAWFFNDFFLHNIWFSGWMPILVSLLVLLFLRNVKLFAGVVVVIGLLAALNYGWIYDNLYQAKIDNGDAERLGLWQNNIDLVVEHPLFGVGPAGYAVYYMTYHPLDARSTHNNYFDIVAQTGVIGAVIFIWLVGSFLWIGLRLRFLTRGRGDFEEAFAAAAFAGMFGMLVAMFLGDWVLPFAYNQTITGFDNAVFTWMILGAMAALYSILKQPSEPEELAENS